ncbi:MAG: WxcM-like domain-containing protein [Bacillota bacterium]|jgi:dTDP-4-dehydrorhamnose 3,5-epimerase-like enzyme
MNIEIIDLEVIRDNRGWLTEVLKSGPEAIEQVHFSVSEPGAIRGNHYHKRRVEWMFVSNGVGKIVLVDNHTKEKKELVVTGERPVLVKIQPNVIHTITNCANVPMHLFILTDKTHSAQDTDTFRADSIDL